MKSAALPCLVFSTAKLSPASRFALACFPNLVITYSKTKPNGPMKPCKLVGQISAKISCSLRHPAIILPKKATPTTANPDHRIYSPNFSCCSSADFLSSPLRDLLLLRQEYCCHIQNISALASIGCASKAITRM